jgi:tetratricopeptide (TPR) repeat protein
MRVLANTYDGPEVRSYDPILQGAKDSLATNNQYAMVAANRALEFNKDNPEAYDIRHWTYKRMNMYKEAKADLDKAYELNPSDSYFLAYAYYYIDINDYSEAIKYLNRYFLADPAREELYWNQYTKAVILDGLGDELGARKAAEQVLRMLDNVENDQGYRQLAKELLDRIR